MSTPAAPLELDAFAQARAKSRERHRAILDQMLAFGLTRLQQLDAPPQGTTAPPPRLLP